MNVDEYDIKSSKDGQKQHAINLPVSLYINVIWIVYAYHTIYVCIYQTGQLDNTPWFINNGTVQITDLSADADVLGIFFCITGNLWNHGMYLCMYFKSLIIFGYQ